MIGNEIDLNFSKVFKFSQDNSLLNSCCSFCTMGFVSGSTSLPEYLFPKFRSELADLGVPNYSCPGDLMKPSKTIPTNVNSVRPADIKVVMNLGDSLSVRGISRP